VLARVRVLADFVGDRHPGKIHNYNLVRDLSKYFSHAMYLCFENNDAKVDIKLIGLEDTSTYLTELKDHYEDTKSVMEKIQGLDLLKCLVNYASCNNEVLLQSTIDLLVDKMNGHGFYNSNFRGAIRNAFGSSIYQGHINPSKKLVKFIEQIAPSTEEANELIKSIFPKDYHINIYTREKIFQYLVNLAKRISKDDQAAYQLLLDVLKHDDYSGLRKAYNHGFDNFLKIQIDALKKIAKFQPNPVTFFRGVLLDYILDRVIINRLDTLLTVLIALGETGIFDVIILWKYRFN